MGEKPYKHLPLIISICLVAAIFAVYWPVYNYDFIKYDDDTYVTDNTNIQSGLNSKSIRWAFAATRGSNWHPVTWLSHILDWQLFGQWGGGHHLVNVLLHTLNTLLLLGILMRMTGDVWPSAFVAALFALHPLHVESVAWVAERKDVLSTFFWLLTIWAYSHYVRNLKLKWYLSTFVLFVLGLMSKPMLVTLPFVLLLLDYWPLERKISLRLLLEKIPFFICSLASSVITFLVQHRSGTMATIESFGLKTRINNAIVSYMTYIIKMFWPSNLAVLYPHPGNSVSMTRVVICGLLLVLISMYFIYKARRYKFLTVGWLWYLGMMVPVIGLVQVGAQALADRYTYMTLTGLFIITAWGIKEFTYKWRHRNGILILSSVIILTACSAVARQQVKYWKNSLALFEHTIQITENNYLILSNYATCLGDAGRFDEAFEQFDKVLRMKPDSGEVFNNFGHNLLKAGRINEAVERLRLAVKYGPELLLAYYNLANALESRGDLEEAVLYYSQAVKIQPDYLEAYIKLAAISTTLKKPYETINFCNKILDYDRNNVFAHGYLGMAIAAVGKTDEAIKEIRFVLNARPNDIDMHRNLGVLLEAKGQTAEAIKSYHAALQIDPDNAKARQLLDAALKKQQVP